MTNGQADLSIIVENSRVFVLTLYQVDEVEPICSLRTQVCR
jgi:hypothetical protein